MVAELPLPDQVVAETREALSTLAAEYGPQTSFAVRSSATAEDLPTASFAGQHESYLNIRGDGGDALGVRHCFASLLTDVHCDTGRQRLRSLKVFNSAGVMKMVRSDLA